MGANVAFLMAVRDGGKTVRAAVESVLGQTLGDLQLLVVDDGSTDATAEILRAVRDERLRVVANEKCMTLPAALNRGLELATGEYVARIDADDVCVAERAARQVAFLDARPEVAVAGSFIETFRDDPMAVEGRVEYPTDPAVVAATLVVRCPLAHPSVMIRKAALDKHRLRYDERFPKAQDYDLWCRCVHAGLKLANVPEVLLKYRINPQQTSGAVYEFQHAMGDRVRSEMLVRCGFGPTEREIELHSAICRERFGGVLSESVAWLEELLRRNEKSRVFERESLGRVLCGRWVRIVRRAREVGVKIDIERSPFLAFVHEGALS